MPRPPRPWLRFYSETLENRKAQELGKSDPALFVHWVNLLCLANLQTPRGYLPREIVDISFALRVLDGETTQILITLRQRKFLDSKGERLAIHDWKSWNPDSDANLTPARAKRHSGTPKERGRNAVGTSSERIEKSREEEEEEREEEKTEKKTRARQPRRPLVVVAERSFGRLLSPTELELLAALEDEQSPERIEYAFRVAAENNVRKMVYVKGVCENEEQNGDSHERPNGGASKGASGRNDPATPPNDVYSLYRGNRPVFVLDPYGESGEPNTEHPAPN